MILLWLIVIPMVAGVLAWAMGGNSRLSRVVSLLAMLAELALTCVLWARSGAAGGRWLEEVRFEWIPAWGICFHLAIDGLSLLMLVLSAFLGVLSVGCSWKYIKDRVGFFHFNLLWVLSGIMGVFMALDLFLFFFFWEVMLVPMYFLIGLWGHERRLYAAIKFFLFTQISGMLMLVSIVGLVFAHHAATGKYTFEYTELLGTPMSGALSFWLMLGFLAAFCVKLPIVPFHNWLPDAHGEAPTAGSLILAGLLLKTGAYGLIRFVVPLFPSASAEFASAGMTLGVIGILYGAVVAFGQSDLKRLVAYTSVSHMGFVMLGVFAWAARPGYNDLAMQGVVMQMICHGLSTGALFILVGALDERIHSRDLSRMGGLWATVPRMSGVGMVFAMASLGLPGLGNFVAEYLILQGAWNVDGTLTILAAIGLVLAAVYSLWIVQKAFHGPNTNNWKLADLDLRESAIMTSLIAAILWLGVYPRPVLDTAATALKRLQASRTATTSVLADVPETGLRVASAEKGGSK